MSHETRLYRFVHVDVDLYQRTKASLWPRLMPGGVMVCDDSSTQEMFSKA